MELKLYDTLAGEKRVFTPLDPARIRMYVCGPTVYDFAHIGNARPVIVFDVLFRLLRRIYGLKNVFYIRNITDVDDKINARAAEEYPDLPLNEAIRRVTERTDKQFHRDIATFGCLPPTVEPRATDHIEDMKALIERLAVSGHAYVAEEHVLFSVPSMPDYGKLSKQSLDEMIAGARVEVTPYKRNPMDFVLWKPSQPGEPAWPSPCGIATPGRPGWHIECSAMAWKYLGETFDIHGGGIDLVFPHHENEIAQTRCAFHSPVMANFWMHNGFLQVEGKKMAKSEGNFITIRELRSTKSFGGRKWSGGVLKFAMLQTHYRQPIDWTVRLLEQSESRLERWRSFAAERTVRRTNQNLMSEFLDALGDDLNTPAAFSIVDQVVDEEKGSDEDRYTVNRILLFLGIKTRKSRVARVAESIEILISELGNFSKHDWENLTSSASRRPILTSGNFKPETKLFTSLDALTSVWEEIKPPMEYAKWPISIEEFRNRLVERGKPTETEFEARVRRLISQREAARKAKDWAESDRIRDELQALGVVVKDSKEGPIWEILRR